MARSFRGFLLVAGILLVSASASAQGIGSIFGKVTDSTGGVMPGVSVTVAGAALQQPLTAVTGSTGTYQFPTVPIGDFNVTFELTGFKKAVRKVIITAGFAAPIDQKLDVGNMTDEVMVSAAPPVVDTKKVNTGSTFTKDILENIPTARDPWQIINMTPGVQAGINVGGSSSGQQVGLTVFGSSSNVQWNLEGGSITDLSSNSSPSYFNFDSFEQIQVVTGGGDVSVQSGGLSINLVTKSGSNVFKGTAVGTFENDKMQGGNVTRELFNSGSSGFLSGAPLFKIQVYSGEYGGPIKKNRLWFWAATDYQDIHAGVLNFFDATKGDICNTLIAAQKAGTSLSGLIKYEQLDSVQKCLQDDTTIIKDLQWKFNYQLNPSNKFQYLFQSDNKYRNRRGASANTTVEAVTQQTSDMPKGIGYWGLPLPTHSVTHTLILSDRLVFNNMFTYVHGGFFLDYQDVPKQGDCGQSRYIARSTDNGAYAKADGCLWNVQALNSRTTGLSSRSLVGTYQTERHSWEAKTDGTYFLTNKLGGDHSLKFGLGWRRNPILSFSHYSGGARAEVQCVGNTRANCGSGANVAVGSATGVVPYRATLYRDTLRNNDWWTYNGYIQNSYSRGKLRLNGGVRYDWQTSKFLGGCVPANVLLPTLLPAQCEDGTNESVNLVTGERTKLQPFSNFAPRISATYDLMGNGKTSVHASGSYYFDTKITLANSLGGLETQPELRWGPNSSSGACSTTANAPCWNDANRDGFVQVNELIGIPSSGSSRFNLTTGVFSPAGNLVDKSAKIGRTREAIVGVQHELIPNLAIGVDYVYRRYDRGTTSYTIGYEPGAAGFPLAGIYTTQLPWTDPASGISTTYYVPCATCVRPSGVGSITMTNLNYQTYQGVILTANKRFSNKWQMNSSLTIQDNPGFRPAGGFTNPTGIDLLDGASTIAKYLLKINGSYQLPWQITAAANYNINGGATRNANNGGLTINGPGSVFGGVNSAGAATTISYGTLNFEENGSTRFQPVSLLDVSLQKVVSLRGGKNRVKVMLDGFNMFNVNTITNFSGNNRSIATSFNSPTSIIPPRVFRVGAQISF